MLVALPPAGAGRMVPLVVVVGVLGVLSDIPFVCVSALNTTQSLSNEKYAGTTTVVRHTRVII